MKLLIILCLVFLYIFIFALCKASSISEEREQAFFEEWKKSRTHKEK